MGYTKDTIKGISWVGALRLTTRGISILRTIILARILLPSQFGAFGIAAIVVAFLEIMTETGVNVILVQKKERIEEYINSAWIVSIIRGLFISLVVFFSASLVAEFFHSKDSQFLLQLISVVPLVRGFINPSIVKFQKNLQFNKEFWFRFSVFLADAAITIILAILTRSASSFVYGMIAGVLLEVFLSWIIVIPRPRFILEPDFVGKIIHSGKWVTASGILNYLFHNTGSIVVGKITSVSLLGVYQLAYSISILPLTEITEVFTKVTFPVFSKISNDIDRLRRAFFKTLVFVSFFSIIFGILLYMFSEPIVLLILGNKWILAIPLIKIFTVFAVIKAISNSTIPLFLSVNKQKYVSVITFVSAFTLLTTVFPFVSSFGIVGASYSLLIGSIVSLPLVFYYSFKILYGKL